MSKQIDQRNDPDLMFFANIRNSLCLFVRKSSFVGHFRTGMKLKAVIHPEDEHIDRAGCQLLFDELNEFVQAIRGGRRYAESAHGQCFIDWAFRSLQAQHSEQQEPDKSFHENQTPTSCPLAGFADFFACSARMISRMNSAAS